MASPACHPCYPGSPICRFWQFSLGQMSQPSPYVHGVGNSIFLITRLHLGSLALQPAGLLDPPNGPLSRNLGFWVTPHTSFKLHGRTAEFPWSRFTGQVMRRTRHTDVVEFFHLFSLSQTSSALTFQLVWSHLATSRIEQSAWRIGHSVNTQTFFLG